MVSIDRDALVALFRATDGLHWRDNKNWDTDAELRTWQGVTADVEGRVIELNLSNNNLHGKSFVVPEAVGLGYLPARNLRGARTPCLYLVL